jgi:DNA-binding NtrC family response regulator
MQYDWPGNVRELENTIERAVVLGVSNSIQPEDLPDALLEGESPGDEPASSLHTVVREAKKRAVLQALDQTGGSQTEAAKLLGVHAVHLSRLIKTLGLKVR